MTSASSSCSSRRASRCRASGCAASPSSCHSASRSSRSPRACSRRAGSVGRAVCPALRAPRHAAAWRHQGHPIAPPQQHGCLPWPQEPASGPPKVEGSRRVHRRQAGLLLGAPDLLGKFIPLDPGVLNINNPPEAFVLSCSLVLSTSAFVFPVLKEKGWEEEPVGEAATSVLLLQDLAVAPLLVSLPYIVGQGPTEPNAVSLLTAKATLGFGTVLYVGSLLLRRIFALVATPPAAAPSAPPGPSHRLRPHRLRALPPPAHHHATGRWPRRAAPRPLWPSACSSRSGWARSPRASASPTRRAPSPPACCSPTPTIAPRCRPPPSRGSVRCLPSPLYRAQIQADILPFKGILLGARRAAPTHRTSPRTTSAAHRPPQPTLSTLLRLA